jgi:hypothetical protein
MRHALAATLALAFVAAPLCADDPPLASRWSITDDGGIEWAPKVGEAHADHVEMSGLQLSVIVDYGIDKTGHFLAKRQVVWPTLRFQPNKTRDHLALVFGEDALPRVHFDQALPRNEIVTRVYQKGLLRVEGFYQRNREIAFTRTLFPSPDKPAVFDRTVFTNRSDKDVLVEIEANDRRVTTNPARGVYGGYVATSQVLDAGERTLKPGESTSFTIVVTAHRVDADPGPFDPAAEEDARCARLARVLDELQLETPDRVLDTAFAFAKMRTTESIYKTKNGLMHGPGGGNYYAAIWANDQAEYANPFFAMLHDPIARESAINAYRLFARHVNPEYKPIPSSIISEGADFWNGAKDRGDMAMIAYGAARFALAYGDRKTAEELWPLIEWCLEYSKRKVNKEGVVASDSDELENRFPSGVANLCTSSLYYDALISSAALARDLGKPAALAKDYTLRAQAMRTAIEGYFGRSVEGFDTYRYFDKATPSAQPRHAHYAQEPDHLRAWICIPLTVGLYERKDATLAALFSPRLWTADGLATEAGKEDFWDRSTLYALRGAFAAGDTARALDHLTYFSNRRLLGEHVPYPIEAWPENNQRHLAAESALYCRIFTEGLFGVRPIGLRSFQLTPRLPKEWPAMALKHMHAFGEAFDLAVARANGKLKVTVTRDGKPVKTVTIADGETTTIAF